MTETSNPEPVDTNTRQSKQAFWNYHVDTWRKSELTQVQYCLENQLNKHTFTYWKSKLEKQSLFPPLLPVAIQPEIKQTSSSNHSGITIGYHDRFHIRLEADFNRDTLSRLIDLLEDRSCLGTT